MARLSPSFTLPYISRKVPRGLFSMNVAEQADAIHAQYREEELLKIHYDPASDRLAIHLSSASPQSTEEAGKDVRLLLDSDGRLLGLEVSHASQRADLTDLGIPPAASVAPSPGSAATAPSSSPSPVTDASAAESTPHTSVTIFTDGACLGNPGPGGWAARLKYPDGRIAETGGADSDSTNNRMELLAAIRGLEKAGDISAITLVTDSEYLRNGITKWIRGWKRRGWQTTAKKPVLNQDLWRQLDQLSGPHITWKYTRGHAGDPDNERCDTIAQTLARGGDPVLRED